jgi:hypothetical protein
MVAIFNDKLKLYNVETNSLMSTLVPLNMYPITTMNTNMFNILNKSIIYKLTAEILNATPLVEFFSTITLNDLAPDIVLDKDRIQVLTYNNKWGQLSNTELNNISANV